jgi:hypothetical protein
MPKTPKNPNKKKMSAQKKSLIAQTAVCVAAILGCAAMLIIGNQDILLTIFDVALIAGGAYGLYRCIKELKSGKYKK